MGLRVAETGAAAEPAVGAELEALGQCLAQHGCRERHVGRHTQRDVGHLRAAGLADGGGGRLADALGVDALLLAEAHQQHAAGGTLRTRVHHQGLVGRALEVGGFERTGDGLREDGGVVDERDREAGRRGERVAALDVDLHGCAFRNCGDVLKLLKIKSDRLMCAR